MQYNNFCGRGNAGFLLKDFFNQNKSRIVFFSLLIFVSLLTGIFTAIKLSAISSSISLDDFSLIVFVDGNAHTITNLFNRFLSSFLILLLLLFLSYNFFTASIGCILIIYRGYLIGLNCTILVICCGFVGVLNSVLIIFPCQVIIMLILIFIFSQMILNFMLKRRYGCISNCLSSIKVIIIGSLAIFLICIIENVLLLIFQANVILVI